MWPFLLHAVIKLLSVTRCEQSGFCSRTQLLFGCFFLFCCRNAPSMLLPHLLAHSLPTSFLRDLVAATHEDASSFGLVSPPPPPYGVGDTQILFIFNLLDVQPLCYLGEKKKYNCFPVCLKQFLTYCVDASSTCCCVKWSNSRRVNSSVLCRFSYHCRLV